ncbi:MAG: TonB-dependent receptor family protein [Bacteroidia bacterium]|nr:TonB-dependent receptor family protein [Bacteroidia bacterium]
MVKKIVLFVVLLTTITSLSAQKYTVEGILRDSTGNGIEVASVVLLNAADSVMAGFSITNPKGRFKIDDLVAGSYLLSATYLGYQDHNQQVVVEGIEKTIDLGVIEMLTESTFLSEVNVTDTYIPIKIKKDTVEYNAEAFKTQAQDNVEELLKKLPGVEVDDDGTITAHGEEVEKITVDGKEFFTNDPTIATKNLPAEAVEKLQVFDESSDMAAFTGIDDGERTKTINLVLKEGQKAGYFGKAELGYGNEDRYSGNFNINRFTSNTQLSLIGMSNNVNVQGFSFRDYIDFMGGLGNFMSGGGGRGQAQSTGIPLTRGGLGDGIVNTDAGGINFSWDLSKKVETSTSYFYTSIENIIDQEIFRQNLLANAGYTTEQDAMMNNLSTGHNLNTTVRANMDSSQRIVARISASFGDGSSESSSQTFNFTDSRILTSQGIQSNMSSGDNLRLNANVTYLKRLSTKGRYITTNLRLGFLNNDRTGFVDNQNLFMDNGFRETVDVLQSQLQNDDQFDYLVKVSFTEPLGGRKYFEANISRQNFNNDFVKDFYDLYPDQQPDEVLNEMLSNAYKRDFTYNSAGFNFKLNTNKSSLTVGANLQQSLLNGELQENPIPIEKDYLSILPKLSYVYDINATSSLQVNYSTRIGEPSLEQLQPIVDNSDPLNIYVGNPDLETQYTHNVRVNYRSFSQFSNVGFFGNVNFRYTDNSITNERMVDEFFVTTTQPINTDYATNMSVYFNFNAPLKFIKHRISISNRFSTNANFLFVNNLENKTNRINNSVTLSFDNWKKDFIDFRIGTRIGYSSTKYSESTDLNQNYIDYQYFTEIDLDFKKDWTFTTNFRYTTYSDEDFGEQISLPIWRASISKVFAKSKKWRAELGVFDILDQNKNINRTSNINFIQDERIVSIGRYFMVTLGYSFSGFSQSSDWGRGRGRGH